MEQSVYAIRRKLQADKANGVSFEQTRYSLLAAGYSESEIVEAKRIEDSREQLIDGHKPRKKHIQILLFIIALAFMSVLLDAPRSVQIALAFLSAAILIYIRIEMLVRLHKLKIDD